MPINARAREILTAEGHHHYPVTGDSAVAWYCERRRCGGRPFESKDEAERECWNRMYEEDAPDDPGVETEGNPL